MKKTISSGFKYFLILSGLFFLISTTYASPFGDDIAKGCLIDIDHVEKLKYPFEPKQKEWATGNITGTAEEYLPHGHRTCTFQQNRKLGCECELALDAGRPSVYYKAKVILKDVNMYFML